VPAARKSRAIAKWGRRRCHDAHEIDAAEKFTVVREYFHSKFARRLRARLGSGVDHGHELAIGCLGILLGVKAAEIADTDHRCSEFAHDGAIMLRRPQGTRSLGIHRFGR
jgi:hypothetical protein